MPETKLHIIADRLENDIYVICFKLREDVSLEQFTEVFRTFSLSKISIEKIKMENLMVTKFTRTNSPLSRYFFKVNSKIYMLQMVEYGANEYVRSIIKNSKWDL